MNDCSHPTLITLFEAQVVKMPSAVAVVFDAQYVTYEALNEKANRIAHFLIQNGVASQTIIAVCMQRSIDLLPTLLAILKIGCAYLPLDPSHPKERLLTILEDASVVTLIASPESGEYLRDYSGELYVLDAHQPAIARCSSENPLILFSSKDLAYVIYTSGSTGKPKGVLIEHQSVVNYAQWFMSYSKASDLDVMDWSCNYIFDMAVTASIVPLLYGLKIIMCTEALQKNVRAYLAHLKASQVSIIKITPSYFKELLREVLLQSIELPDLKTIILGGEALRQADCRDWLGYFPHHVLYNEYGPTEATVAVSSFCVTVNNVAALDNDVPIGKPGPGMGFHLLDEKLHAVAPGEVGMLYIEGLCLARGYLNQPQLTKTLFIQPKHQQPRLYKTGDLCRQRSDGEFDYLGRMDNQVKLRGFRIDLSEIERVLMQHDDFFDVRVRIRNDKWHQQLVAYCILNPKIFSVALDDVRVYLKQQLPDYMVPSAFVFLASFPLTKNGKLDEQALPAPSVATHHDLQMPLTETQEVLVKIWSEELNVADVGLHDNFFDLGGHSLIAIRIVSRLSKAFGKDISLFKFYEALTIERFIPILEQSKALNVSEEVTKVKTSNFVPLSDFQLMLWASRLFEPNARQLNMISRKRMQGVLDVDLLNRALASVLSQHRILSHKIFIAHPVQKLRRPLKTQIHHMDLRNQEVQACESLLISSMHELMQHRWTSMQPLVMMRVFFMDNHQVELQLCLSHMIADEPSMELFYAELSHYYLMHQQQKNSLVVNPTPQESSFVTYIQEEHGRMLGALSRHWVYWQEYLKDAAFFHVPEAYRVDAPHPKHWAYSTYVRFPDVLLAQAEQFCVNICVNLNDLFCAVLGRSLIQCEHGDPKTTLPIFMNVVKSTRNDVRHDRILGCFIRMETIKVDYRKTQVLQAIAKNIHQFISESYTHQQCPTLLKFACLNHGLNAQKKMTHQLQIFAIHAYQKILRGLGLTNYFLDFCKKLVGFNRQNQFVINVNVWSNFLNKQKNQLKPGLFGLVQKNIPMHQYDVSEIHGMIDVCFMRDVANNIPYVVISGNLTPEFRQAIADTMMHLIKTEALLLDEEAVTG